MSEWDQIALRRLRAKLDDSAIFLALFNGAWARDPTCLVQLGFALMLEKPIYLVAPLDVPIPRGLARLADGIEFYRGPEDYEAATTRLLAKAKRNGDIAP